MITPPNLSHGDRIAVLSPASVVNPAYIDGAARFLGAEGFSPVIMPHAKGPAQGSFAASDEQRLADIIEALTDPSVRAIFCSRGGYGCNHLLDKIPINLVSDNPKWLIGFSDISALHALWNKAGVVSLHAPMAKHLTLLPADHYCTQALLRLLTRGLPLKYSVAPHPFNISGQASGRLIGGNLAVINGLAATPFDPLANAYSEDTILFIEDIAEKIYAVERMLIRLILAGSLQCCKAVVIGSFTDYSPDRNHPDMETMIRRLLRSHSLHMPVAFGFPAGHTDDNLPLPLGAHATISVSDNDTTLSFL